MRKRKLFIAVSSLILILSGFVLGIIFLLHKSKEAKVVTTIYPIYDIVRNILGNDDDVIMLQENGNMHGYQPGFKEIATLSKAELFIYIGGSSDSHWVGDLISESDHANLKTLALMDVVDKIEDNLDGIIQDEDVHKDHQHDEDTIYDEHIWLSIRNTMKMVKAIADKLVLVFPTKIGIINENCNDYLEKLENLDKKYSLHFDSCNEKMIIADKFPFRYLLNDYKINYTALFSSCSSENTVSFDSRNKIIESLNTYNVNYLVVIKNSSNISVAQSIIKDGRCDNKNIEIVYLDECSSVATKDLENTSYIDLMEQNLETLIKVLVK